jgi:PAS domain S-box-containing protein
MKIRSQLIVSAISFCVIAIAIGFTLFVTFQRLSQLEARETAAEKLVLESHELSDLSNDHILFHEKRQKAQWEAKYNSLSTLLSKLRVSRPREQAFIDSFLKDQKNLKTVFDQVDATLSQDAGSAQIVHQIEFLQVSWSRLSVPIQGMIFHASRLARLTEVERDAVQHQAAILIIGMIGVLTVFIVLNYIFINRRVLRSLTNLQEGTTIIGAGNLDYRIEDTSRDEIGSLARAFNRMSVNLKEVTASKEELNGEVAERRRAEHQLAMERERLAVTLRSIGDGVISTDTEGRVLSVNEMAERLTGWLEKEAFGRPLEEVFHIINEKTRQPCENPVQRVLQDGQTVGLANHTLLISREGIERVLADSGAPIRDEKGEMLGVVLVFRDVTERVRAAEQLRAREEMLRAILATSPVGIVLTRDKRIKWANGAWAQMFGFASEREYLDQPTSVMHSSQESYENVRNILYEHVKSGQVAQADAHGRRKNGEILETFIRSSLLDPSDPSKGTISVITDISERKKAEESMRESEERYRSLFENMIEGFSYCKMLFENGQPHDFIYLAVNDAFEKQTGLKDVAGKMVSEVIPGIRQTDPDLFKIYGRVAMTGQPESFEMFVEALQMWFWVSAYSPKSEHFVAVFDVITDRKRAEEQVQRQGGLLSAVNLVLREALEAETDADIARTCLRMAEKIAGSRFGFIGEVNQSGRLDTIAMSDPGWSGCRIPKTNVPLVINDMEIRGIWASVLKSDQSHIINDPISHPDSIGVPDGHPPLVSFMGVPLRRLGKAFGVIALANKEGGYCSHDVADVEALSSAFVEALDRKRAESALHKSEEKYRSLFEESIDGICITSRNGTLIDANRSFLELFGYTREESLGKSVLELYANPADRTPFMVHIEREGSAMHYPLKLRKKDGTQIECSLSATIRRDADGTILGYRGIIRDITAQENLQKQLLQAQKMEAVGTLAGGVAHDFNNILQVALGYSELLAGDEGLPRRHRGDLQKIYEAARRGADLVQRLLTFSRKTEIKPQPLDLNRRINEIRKMIERTIPKMIDIQLFLAEDLATINADPTQLDQVLMNLAVNARDAMPEGGKLVVETANIFVDEEYSRRHLDAKSGDHVLLTITDTGAGMDKETLEHIFEPFFTTKESGQGTGLGLATVLGIVQQHEGFIRCYSEPGHGTTFKIYFPSLVSEEESKETVIRTIPRGGSETILLVDDEEHIAELGKRILEKAGYTVLTAKDGRQALDLYTAHRDKISLVILDLIMPKMGGKQCLRELAKTNPSIKVIIASGYSANGHTKNALESGAKGFVNKPYDIRQVLEVVRGVLDAA